ncbi:MAG TPA: cytochrome c3 family protein, partial [Polyangia bacterium]
MPTARIGGTDAAAPQESGPPPTAMAAALAAAGLDAARLPPLDEVGDAQRAAVMDTFARALGIGCGDCHEADYAVATPRTRIARKMWDRLARGLVRKDGGALYCDSCHAGRATFLDRSDGALGRWMQASYVTPLERRDGAAHDCSTCHGSPFVGNFLDDWGASDDAPDGGTAPPRDLGASPGDLGVVGCESLLACLDGCAAGDGACAGACKRHASAAAKALLAAAQKCANDACIAAGRCRSAADDSADCNACFSNASAGGATGVACAPHDDPSCGACAAQWL